MTINKMMTFRAALGIIGINPFVFVPDHILSEIFVSAGKNKGHISVRGQVNNKPYKQTLVKYSGEWRLYINTVMLKNSPRRVGELLEISIEFDPGSRQVEAPPLFIQELNRHPEAKNVFEKLPPYQQKEIVRYLANLKTRESVDKNIKKAIEFLMGKGRFAGRDNS